MYPHSVLVELWALFFVVQVVLGIGAENDLCPTSQWTKRTRISPSTPIQLRISLALQEDHGGEEKLLDISNPASSKFGQHLSSQQVVAAFAPPPGAVRSVTEWLDATGIPADKLRRSPCGSHIFVNVTAEEAEDALNAQYYEFIHRTSGQTHIGCESYDLPTSIRPLLDFVTPTACTPLSPIVRKPISPKVWGNKPVSSRSGRHHFGRHTDPGPYLLKRDASNATVKVDCTKFTTPDCLRELYHIPLGGPVHPNNSLGIYQISWATWLPDDMDKFFEMFQPALIGKRPVVEAIDGGFMQDFVTGSAFNLEPNLDFQYSMALVAPQPVINLQVGDMYLGGNLNNLLASFDSHYCGALDPEIDPIYPDTENPDGYNSSDCGNHVAPKVISISYAYDEADFPPEYLRRQCLEYLKLGLMGVTVLVATGDSGPAGGERYCINTDTGIPDSDDSRGRFNPTFPASCPWVTAVGGTQRVRDLEASANETAYTRQIGNHTSSSGGGFSNIFPAPWFQVPHTSRYLFHEKHHLSDMKSRFNSHGRGIPDVSALATEYLVVIEGKTLRVHGTSASTPVWGSIISKINNERMVAGKGPVGFINPALYSFANAMSDVNMGYTSGCGFSDAFAAVGGWDAATGLGSPLYDHLLAAFMKLL